MILYLHGFRSSPQFVQGARGRRAGWPHWAAPAELVCPQLPASPKAAMALALSLVERRAGATSWRSSAPRWAAITPPGWPSGSAAARCCSTRRSMPLKDLDQHVGVTTAWHSDQPFEFKREYIDELRALAVDQDHPARTLFPDRRDRRRSARLPRHGGALRRRAPARDRRQRPCDPRICRLRRRRAGLLPAGSGAVRAASLRQARWHRHVNAVAPAAAHARLADRRRLADRAAGRAQPRVPRAAAAPAHRAVPGRRGARDRHGAGPGRVWEREVLLRCDDRPVVFAHTVVPMSASATDWPLFGALGERSLGSTLFYDPLVRRGELEFARLRAGHPLVQRARAALGDDRPPTLFTMRAAACTGAIKARCWSPRYSCLR